MFEMLRKHIRRRKRFQEREKLFATIRSLGYEVSTDREGTVLATPASHAPYYVKAPDGSLLTFEGSIGFARMTDVWRTVIADYRARHVKA